MRKLLFCITIALMVTEGMYAQIREFESWVKKPEGELAAQKFANAKLDRSECQRATEIIDSLWLRSSAKRLGASWKKMILANDSLRLACACRNFGMPPKDGHSLYISLHGGGECPKEVNDGQWMNQIYLYQLNEGVYVAPRAPWNTWDLWHKKGLDELLEELIQACVLFEGVNPNKVYLLGYSAGGDGVWRLAPRMADKWAAAAMMAGHPGNASQKNLLNLPFTIWMGAEDAAYDRNRLAKEKGEVLDSLAATNPGKYIHKTNIIEGKGHWMDGLDADAIGWMAQYRRNPYPKRIIWRQEEVVREHFYWLSAPADELQHGKTVEARIEGNTIHIDYCDYKKLTIYLNDNMLNLDKKVVVRHKGKKIASRKLRRNITNLYNTLNTRNDRSYSFPCMLEINID